MSGDTPPHGRGSLAPFHFASVPSGRARILLSPQGSHEQNACETFFFYYPNTHPSQTRRIRPDKEDRTRQGGQDQARRRRAPFISMALSLWKRIRKRRLQKKKWRTKNELRRDRRTDMGVLQPRLPCNAEGDLGVHLNDIRVHFVQVLLHLLSLLDDGAQLISISRCPLEELHGAFVNEVHGR